MVQIPFHGNGEGNTISFFIVPSLLVSRLWRTDICFRHSFSNLLIPSKLVSVDPLHLINYLVFSCHKFCATKRDLL